MCFQYGGDCSFLSIGRGEVKIKFKEVLSFIEIQYSCLGSVDKALEMVTDISMTMACNLQLARRDMTLK